MKPNKPGIYEWFEEDGTKRLVEVVDVGISKQCLRVYFWGGYYYINDREGMPVEWADRWGDFVGENGSLPEDQIYWKPTEEQRKKIFDSINKK